jgi:hypothetical protein
MVRPNNLKGIAVKRTFVIALVVLLAPSFSLAGWAADESATCACPCHAKRKTEAGNAKIQAPNDESVNMLNNVEQKAGPAENEFLREQIYSW